MTLVHFKEKMKTQIQAYFIKFYSWEKQIKWSLKIIDKKVKAIIEKEELTTVRKRLCYSRWEGFMELVLILVVLEDKAKLNMAYRLMGEIMDNGSFHHYLHEIEEALFKNHPVYLRINYDIEQYGNLDE